MIVSACFDMPQLLLAMADLPSFSKQGSLPLATGAPAKPGAFSTARVAFARKPNMAEALVAIEPLGVKGVYQRLCREACDLVAREQTKILSKRLFRVKGACCELDHSQNHRCHLARVWGSSSQRQAEEGSQAAGLFGLMAVLVADQQGQMLELRGRVG